MASSSSSSSSSAEQRRTEMGTTKVVTYDHTCPQCGRVFQRGSGLARHIRSVHTKERTYACEFCPQAYARTDLLQRHVSLYHKHMKAQKDRMRSNGVTWETQNTNRPVRMDTDPLFALNISPADSAGLTHANYTFPQMMEDGPGSEMEVMENRDFDMSAWEAANFGLVDTNAQMSAPWPVPGQLQSTTPPAPSAMDFDGLALYPQSSSSSDPGCTSGGRNSSMSTLAPSGSSTTGSEGQAATPPLSLHPLMDLATSAASDFDPSNLITPISSAQNSRRSSAAEMTSAPFLSTPFFDDQYTTHLLNMAEQERNVHLFQQNCALHLPFIHLASLSLSERGNDELDDDLRRAMGIVGARYSSTKDADQMPFYPQSRECSMLKSKMLQSIEEIQDFAHRGVPQHYPSKRLLLRRTQTMVLLQLGSMFGHKEAKNDLSIKLSHGSLIVIARALLQEFEGGEKHDEIGVSTSAWPRWVQHEEIVRTLWIVYIVDSLLSCCHGTHPWLSLAELARVPDFSNDRLWNAQSDVDFQEAMRAHATNDRANYPTDLVKSLKSGSSISFPRAFSLAGNLVVLISLVAEIMAIAQTDYVERRQLAVQLKHAQTMSPVPSQDVMRLIEQSVHRINANLRQQLDEAGRRLTQWLSLLHLSTPYGKTKGSHTPFLYDFMPWYWTATHTLGLLNKRIQWTAPSPSSDSFPFPLTRSFGSLSRKKSVDSVVSKLSEHLVPYGPKAGESGSTARENVDLLSLLVRIRISLNSLDGGASMQAAIGNEKILDFLPEVPLSDSWLLNLFPAFL